MIEMKDLHSELSNIDRTVHREGQRLEEQEDEYQKRPQGCQSTDELIIHGGRFVIDCTPATF